MNSDNTNMGYRLTRRETLRILGSSGILILAGCQSKTSQTETKTKPLPNSDQLSSICVVRPEQTEGPYFIDEGLKRSDIRNDPSDGSISGGIPLILTLRLGRIQGKECTPLKDAQVDIWHCDSQGQYSDIVDEITSTKGRKFLRGFQVTPNDGIVRFTTIYPGWYPGRTPHIHIKVRTTKHSGEVFAFTSQMYFEENISKQVYAQVPYSNHGQPNMRNDDDGIFVDGGDLLKLNVNRDRSEFSAEFGIGLIVD